MKHAGGRAGSLPAANSTRFLRDDRKRIAGFFGADECAKLPPPPLPPCCPRFPSLTPPARPFPGRADEKDTVGRSKWPPLADDLATPSDRREVPEGKGTTAAGAICNECFSMESTAKLIAADTRV